VQTYRNIALVLLGALLCAGVVVTRDTVRAQGLRESNRITLTATEWTSGQPFRFVRDGKTLKCYMAALSPRDTTITAMVEAPGACQ
jgi:hypothetical protein